MGLFRKRGTDTVDFTKMPGGGVPNLDADKPKSALKFTNGFVDFRANTQQSQPSRSSASSQNSNSMTNFLSSSSSSNASSSVNSSDINNPIEQVSELSELKLNLRKMTINLENLSNENYRLMQRVELLERKIERLGG